MQAWRRQPTQCIFCAFRQSVASAPSRPTHRKYGTAEGRPRQRRLGFDRSRKDDVGPTYKDTYKQFRFDGQELRSKDKRPLVRKDNAGRTREEAFGEENTADRLRKRENLLKVKLASLNKSLKDETVSNDKGEPLSKLVKLDPNGIVWRAFSDFITSLPVRATGPNATTSEKSLWNILQSASGIALEKELYFAFLDYVLKPSATNELKGDTFGSPDLRYPTEWYHAARNTQRTIHLHVGPTNSGKTHHALKRLQEAKNGFYAGPLRLLAHEVYSRFQANGIHCDLVTGDDVRLDPHEHTSVAASTVEMVNTGRGNEVAVIDEIQMMGDEDRGWAWTRAVLGANATEVHLCGEERVVPLIRELAASMGDSLQIHNYKRLNPLRCMSKSLRGNIKQLRKGDCIVAFSIMELHALRRQIEIETSKRCAIVYGSLPPEVRAQQADLFNNPDNDYDFLVASDAIGMGLNLSVKRIIFSSSTKFDGVKRVQLSIPQIKQIAGRAGRYRSAHQDKTKSSHNAKDDEENVGLVTTLDEEDLPVIRNALMTEAPPLKQAGILPPAEYMEEYASTLPINVPFEYLMRKVCYVATIHPRFFLCDVRDKLRNARIVDDVPGLSIEQRVNITAAPLGRGDPKLEDCLRAFARCIATNRAVSIVDIPEVPLEVLALEPSHDRKYLSELEGLHKALILYLWLGYRFEAMLRDRPMATHAKDLCEQKINLTLRAFSANPKLRQRLKKMQTKQMMETEALASDGKQAIGTKATVLSSVGAETVTAESSWDAEQQSSAANVTDLPREDISQLVPSEEGFETVDEHFRPPNDFTTLKDGEIVEEPEQSLGEIIAKGDDHLPLDNHSESLAEEQIDAPERTSNLDIAGHEEELEQKLPVAEEKGDEVVHDQEQVTDQALEAVLPEAEAESEQPRAASGSG